MSVWIFNKLLPAISFCAVVAGIYMTATGRWWWGLVLLWVAAMGVVPLAGMRWGSRKPLWEWEDQ